MIHKTTAHNTDNVRLTDGKPVAGILAKGIEAIKSTKPQKMFAIQLIITIHSPDTPGRTHAIPLHRKPPIHKGAKKGAIMTLLIGLMSDI